MNSPVATAEVPATLTKAETATAMRCSKRQVQRLVSAGKLAYIRDGAGRLLFLPEFIAEYYARNTHAPAPPVTRPARNPKYR